MFKNKCFLQPGQTVPCKEDAEDNQVLSFIHLPHLSAAIPGCGQHRAWENTLSKKKKNVLHPPHQHSNLGLIGNSSHRLQFESYYIKALSAETRRLNHLESYPEYAAHDHCSPPRVKMYSREINSSHLYDKLPSRLTQIHPFSKSYKPPSDVLTGRINETCSHWITHLPATELLFPSTLTKEQKKKKGGGHHNGLLLRRLSDAPFRGLRQDQNSRIVVWRKFQKPNWLQMVGGCAFVCYVPTVWKLFLSFPKQDNTFAINLESKPTGWTFPRENS